MFTHDLFAVANLVVEHCYSIRQWKSSTTFVDRGKAGVRRGREENGKGRGKGRKCVFTILATDYFSKNISLGQGVPKFKKGIRCFDRGSGTQYNAEKIVALCQANHQIIDVKV